jgi:hypothetical protein
MMKPSIRPVTLLAVLLLLNASSTAQQGYEIKAGIRPFRSGHLFLAYYYGTKQFLIDSARIDGSGVAVFKGDARLQGGVYLIAFPEKNGWIECLIDKQQRFSVTADTADPTGSIRYSGSEDNTLFAEYQRRSFLTGTSMSRNQAALTTATGAEAERIRAEMQKSGRELQVYREDFMKRYPDHLLTAVFHVLKDPEIPPAEKHPGGKYDSSYAYQYYKSHFWDGVSMTDERLIRTPVFQPRLDRYFSEVLPQHPDSLIMAADELIESSKGNPEMFKFLLSTLTEKYVNPAYMGQDAVFVHLFQKYYMTGQADSWMNEKYRKFVFDRGYSLMGNVVGKQGSDFEFLDSTDRKRNLYGIEAPLTVVCFWDPTCGHCQEDVPRLDSIFKSKWKSQGVAMFGMMTDGGRDKWLEFIRRHDLRGWVHGYQTKEMKEADYAANRPNYRQLYDVYQTPMLYLLDKDKRIVAKKLTYQQMDELIQARLKAGGR